LAASCDQDNMQIHQFNPLADSRWDDFLARHPHSSVFHQSGWLKALEQTYGYEPSVLTNAQPGQPLADGIVMCRVSSWMTGSRLVSLPFADHCEPLLNEAAGTSNLMQWIQAESHRGSWQYVEMRPLTDLPFSREGSSPGQAFWYHKLDLRPSLEELFARLHKNSFQRKIRRAEREDLSLEVGNSESMVEEFYRLLLLTRRRHRLLPQPRLWFKNLARCMGERLEIMVARKEGTAIAALLILRHRSTVVYKYGCSDARFHNMGGISFLMWQLIQRSRAEGAAEIDFGRSDLQNQGLTTFKDRLGASKRMITYYRFAGIQSSKEVDLRSPREFWGPISNLPDFVLSTAGRVLYRHMG
jgi:CelD/BcsL family acetyltransferase involved in cellulose biosynthesis